MLYDIVDPEGTLPVVSLEQTAVYRGEQGVELLEHRVHRAGQPIGRMTLAIGGRRRWFDSVRIYEPFRGRGFGTSLHLESAIVANAAGDRFYDDEKSSRLDEKVWRRFIAQGVAEELVPYVRKEGYKFETGGVRAFITEQALESLHAEVRGDVEGVGVGDGSAVHRLDTAKRGDHSAVVGTELGIGVLDDKFWQSV